MMMTRFVVLLLGCLSCASIAAADADTAPNIVVIYVDDLGYGDLASYGHPVIKTPHLDALAADGVTLTRYYAPSPLCSPSRAALLTGRHPYRTGIKSWIPEGSGVFLRDEEITLAELLQDQGYSTALIGKWHLNSSLASTDEPQPTDQGFDYFYGHNAFQIPTSRNPTNLYRNREALGEQEGYIAALYVDEAVQWLEAQRKEQPWLLMFSMAEPHTTFENPPAFNAMYAEYTAGEIVPIPSGQERPPMSLLMPRGPGEYYANVTYMDHQIGRLLDAMKVMDLYEDTVIIFASDNGAVTEDWRTWWEVNAHGSTGGLRGRKHRVYEGGIRVPAIVRIPGVTQAGQVSDALVIGSDFFPTLASLAGVPLPQDRSIDGRNVLAQLAGGPSAERTLVWALEEADGPDFAIRQGRWKLLLDESEAVAALYDLEVDPLELMDVREQHPAEVTQLQQAFKRVMRSIESDPLRPRH